MHLDRNGLGIHRSGLALAKLIDRLGHGSLQHWLQKYISSVLFQINLPSLLAIASGKVSRSPFSCMREKVARRKRENTTAGAKERDARSRGTLRVKNSLFHALR